MSDQTTDATTEAHAADAGIHADVRDYYRRAAAAVEEGTLRDPDRPDERWGAARYDGDAVEAAGDDLAGTSMGCGNPYALADLREGDTVLDLGSGGGLDVILSARRVGPTGKAYGVDFLDEMLDLARRNAAEAGIENVEFLHGMIEDLPLPDRSVDVVISNCVINLAPDKRPVVAEIARVLRPGGRVAISDVVADDAHAAPNGGEEWAECGAGALRESEYLSLLSEVGLVEASIERTHETGPGLFAASVRASAPA
ncbi:MAG: methyltransferase domain-containing protein [Actinomycetota bacterium]